ncbi:hypothetical protein POSPLADRAFT_1157810, partial [Postia placenta MAD-698-R-SB12]
EQKASGHTYLPSDWSKRNAIIQDVGNTLPEVRMEYFFAALLPPLRRSLDPVATVEKLKDKGQIVHDGWACLKGGLAEADENECGDFKSLVDIVQAIADASPHVKDKQLLILRQDPSQAPKANTRSAKSRPYGYLVKAGEQEGAARWVDIGLCAGYSKHGSKKDRNDNVRLVVWSMGQCMREDVRRRFVYGMTIENKTMRLWIMQDVKTVVNMFQALMYAEEHQVGWDPTVAYVVHKNKGAADEIELAEDNSPRVDILVRDEDGEETWFRTNKPISDSGANWPHGRGIRVWKARELVMDERTGEEKEIYDYLVSEG